MLEYFSDHDSLELNDNVSFFNKCINFSVTCGDCVNSLLFYCHVSYTCLTSHFNTLSTQSHLWLSPLSWKHSSPARSSSQSHHRSLTLLITLYLLSGSPLLVGLKMKLVSLSLSDKDSYLEVTYHLNMTWIDLRLRFYNLKAASRLNQVT